jgi:hypothetical protein
MAPPEPKRPKRNRGPEVVQAEGKPEDEKIADHMVLVISAAATRRRCWTTSSRLDTLELRRDEL